MVTVLIELDESLVDRLSDPAMPVGAVTIIESDRLEGSGDLVAALVTLTGVTVPVLGKIVVEAFRSKRHVEIKSKGLTVSGLSERTAVKILSDLMQND